MERRRHHKAEALSPEAQQLIEDGLASQATYQRISDAIKEKTGEKISVASIGRYDSAKVRPRREAIVNAQRIAKEMVEWAGDLGPEAIRQAIAMRTAQELIPMLETLAKNAPHEAARFYSSLEQRRIAEKNLHQRNLELELRTKKLEQEKELADAKLQQIEQKLKAATEKKGPKARTPAELEKLLRDLYGIAKPSEQA